MSGHQVKALATRQDRAFGPFKEAPHVISLLEARVLRLEDAAHNARDQRLAQLEAGSIRILFIHSTTQVGVDRQSYRLDQNVLDSTTRLLTIFDPEAGFVDPSCWSLRKHDVRVRVMWLQHLFALLRRYPL